MGGSTAFVLDPGRMVTWGMRGEAALDFGGFFSLTVGETSGSEREKIKFPLSSVRRNVDRNKEEFSKATASHDLADFG